MRFYFAIWEWGGRMCGGDNSTRNAQELIREANHRLANQLSMLTGMIQIQIEGVRHGPGRLPREHVLELLRSTQSRISTMGNLNRQLAVTSGQDIDLGPFLLATRSELIASLGAQARVKTSDSILGRCAISGEQATVLCLVMNEIVVNALKHAQPADRPLTVTLNCAEQDGKIILELGDDGVGLPADFDESRDGRVGFTVVRSLLRQAGAELELHRSSPGLMFRIVLPRS